jgi:hypothetical protein
MYGLDPMNLTKYLTNLLKKMGFCLELICGMECRCTRVWMVSTITGVGDAVYECLNDDCRRRGGSKLPRRRSRIPATLYSHQTHPTCRGPCLLHTSSSTQPQPPSAAAAAAVAAEVACSNRPALLLKHTGAPAGRCRVHRGATGQSGQSESSCTPSENMRSNERRTGQLGRTPGPRLQRIRPGSGRAGVRGGGVALCETSDDGISSWCERADHGIGPAHAASFRSATRLPKFQFFPM